MKIGAIGDKDTVLGFALAGVKHLRTVETREESKAAFDELLNEDLGVIIITDSIAELLRKEIDRLQSVYPVIVEVPSKHRVMREDPINELIKRAIGVLPRELMG